MDKQREKIIIYVVGTTYEGRQKVLKNLYKDYCLGEKMKTFVKWDKGNKFDTHAMKVIVNKRCIGYVPRRISELIHKAYTDKIITKVRLYDIHLKDSLFGAAVMICI